MRARGFSLLELIVVLAIIGLTAALVAPRLGGSQLGFLKAETRRAVAVLNYARRTALIRGNPSEAVFSGPSEQNETPPPAQGQAEGADYLQWVSRGAGLRPGEGQGKPLSRAAADPAGPSRLVFRFYPEGGSSGGELRLSYAEYTAKITVNPLTGKITSEFVE